MANEWRELWSSGGERLHEIVAELATRPGHEKVRALVYGLLVDGLGASSADVDFERPVPEVRGRLDALLGQTVFEFKRDLRRERPDAEEELTRYLTDRERQTGLRFVGMATDGAEFAPYEQMPPAPIRVVYGASGTLPAAAILRDQRAIVEHKLYWTATSEDEARYLEAVLNSETARSAAAHLQSRGQWGARDFDKVMLELPIPAFAPGAEVHEELVAAARHAEEVAAGIDLPAAVNFIRARGMVRIALRRDGVASRIDALVANLLRL